MAKAMDDRSVAQRVLDHIAHGTTALGEEMWREPVRITARRSALPPRSSARSTGSRRRSDPRRHCRRIAPMPRASRHVDHRRSRADGAFRNACRHRGMQLADRRCAQAFVCRYIIDLFGCNCRVTYPFQRIRKLAEVAPAERRVRGCSLMSITCFRTSSSSSCRIAPSW